MLLLILGLALFVSVHLVPTQTELRKGLVQGFGEGTYKLVFALASLAALALIIIGFHKLQVTPGKNPNLWHPPIWMRHLSFTLMLPAMILLVAAYIPSRIRTAVGHPMLAAIKIWAFSHLLANGDLGSLVLFATFLAWAVYDRISVKKRQAPGPLGAAQPGSIINDVIVVVVGAALYAVMMKWGHGALIGVPLLAG